MADISQIVNRPRSIIQSLINRYGLRKTLKNKSRSERSQKLNYYIGRIIIRMIKQNPKTNTINIVEHLKNNLNIDLSASIVRSFLKNQSCYGRD